MRKKTIAWCVALLMCATPSAFAASTTDLSVGGTITPASCVPSMGGDVDLGAISFGDLSDASNTSLSIVTRHVTVNCSGATRFGLAMTDNRASSRVPGWPDTRYGLGFAGQGEPFGGVEVYFNAANVRVAGAAGAATVSLDGGNSWSPSRNSGFFGFAPNNLIGFTTAAGGTSGPDEPPRDFGRLQLLRRWSHEQNEVFTGSA